MPEQPLRGSHKKSGSKQLLKDFQFPNLKIDNFQRVKNSFLLNLQHAILLKFHQ